MKTLVLSMISIAATVAAMTACTSESDPMNDITNPQDEKVEIKATAGIGEIVTKTEGPVDLGDAMNDIAFIRNDSKTDVDWSTVASTDITATMDASGKITFEPKQYFDLDPTIKTYMIGYHPKSGSSRTDNVVTYAIDGQQDIMCTAPVNGNKTDNKTANMSFDFQHLLTQFSFLIKAENKAAADAWGEITEIKLINQKTNASITLDTKAIDFTDATANQDIIIGNTQTSFNSSDVTTATTFGRPIMVQAEQSEYKVHVTTTNNSQGADVELTVDAKASTSYVITLTFKGTTVNGEATIGEWKTGTGTGDVE